MLIIGFGHRKRVGKDTSANFMINLLRMNTKGLKIKKGSFAWKLKQVCFELYSWAGLKEPEFYDKEENAHLREVVLKEIGKSPRQIWIEFGTNVGRAVYPDTWVDYLFRNNSCDVLIMPDMRFYNEVSKTKINNGFTIKIENDRVPQEDDIADSPLKDFVDWDFVIKNNGTLNELYSSVEVVCKTILERANIKTVTL